MNDSGCLDSNKILLEDKYFHNVTRPNTKYFAELWWNRSSHWTKWNSVSRDIRILIRHAFWTFFFCFCGKTSRPRLTALSRFFVQHQISTRLNRIIYTTITSTKKNVLISSLLLHPDVEPLDKTKFNQRNPEQSFHGQMTFDSQIWLIRQSLCIIGHMSREKLGVHQLTVENSIYNGLFWPKIGNNSLLEISPLI